jgi:hypothetical protein
MGTPSIVPMIATHALAKIPPGHLPPSSKIIFLAHKIIPRKISEKSGKVASFFCGENCYAKERRVTPAMEAGIADHVWTLEELINLVKQ